MNRPIKVSVAQQHPIVGTIARRLLMFYFFVVQPIALFVLPIVRYDEFRFPATEPTYMLIVSITAWWKLGITAFGCAIAVKIWRNDSAAVRDARNFLSNSLGSALLVAALPFVLGSSSFLRTEMRQEQTAMFLIALVVYVVLALILNAIGGRKEDGFAFARKETVPAPRWRSVMSCTFASIGVFLTTAAYRAKPATIFEAAWEGNLAALQRFIQAGIDVNAVTHNANTPLHLACTRDVAQHLIDTPSTQEQNYFFHDHDFKNLPGIAAKLRRRSDPVSSWLWNEFSAEGQKVLADPGATESDLNQVVFTQLNSMLRRRVPLDSRAFANVPVSLAASNLARQNPTGIGALRLNRMLLEDAYPTEIAKWYIDSRNVLKETPLHLAAWNGRLRVADLLLQGRGYVNASNSVGLTPLDYALSAREHGRSRKWELVIELLRKNGAVASCDGVHALRGQEYATLFTTD